MAKKSIREQYREACRAYRIMGSDWHREQLLKDLDWVVCEYALSSYPAAPAYQVPREENRIFAIKSIPFVWRNGKFYRCQEGHIYRDNGEFYVFHNGKFVPHIDDRAEKKAS